MARIDLEGVAKRWGAETALHPIDLTVEDGEFLAILGPSGCGKSTTLFMLAGIYAPSAGAIRFDGAVVNEVEARDRNVGIVFQSYALYPSMTALQNILFPLRFKGVPRPEAEARARAMAGLVQVEELLARRPAEMSGGQQQRVALARALVKEPQLLLLDEPLSNLDASLRLSMRGEIRRLHRRLGVTTILVTHDQIEATTMADRIVCMSKGRIEQVGTAEDLYDRPESLFVASFLGSPPLNLIEGTVEGGTFRAGGGALPVEGDAAGPVVLGVRPEHIRLDGGSIAARVEEVEPHGREIIYLLDSELGTLRAVAPAGTAAARGGDQVQIAIERSLLFAPTTGRRIVTGPAS